MPYEDFDRLFPQGPGARQERYIAAFNGLTALVTSNQPRTEFEGDGQRYIDLWEEMFHELSSEGQ